MKARKRLFPKFYNGACFEKKGSRFVGEGINDCTMLSLSPTKSLAFQVEEMESSTVFYLSLGSVSCGELKPGVNRGRAGEGGLYTRHVLFCFLFIYLFIYFD